MNAKQFIQALAAARPSQQWDCSDGVVSVSDAKFRWLDAAPPPTDAELQTALDTLNAAAASGATIDAAIAGDATVQSLKAMTSAEFDAWWTANVTNTAQLVNVVKRLARLVIRRLL